MLVFGVVDDYVGVVFECIVVFVFFVNEDFCDCWLFVDWIDDFE